MTLTNIYLLTVTMGQECHYLEHSLYILGYHLQYFLMPTQPKIEKKKKIRHHK